MARLKYMGVLDKIEVTGYGHFGHGDERAVDDVTAGAFKDPRCAAEGWVVIEDEPVSEQDLLTEREAAVASANLPPQNAAPITQALK